MVKSHAIAVYFSLLVLAAAGGSTAAVAADTLRCGNRLVSIGDNKAEVLIKCGPPEWKDAWTDVVINNPDTVEALRVNIDRERWIYNLGSHSFLRFLLFENGRLVKIATGDYGFDVDHPSAKRCDTGEIRAGVTQYEILHRCGEPAFKDSRQEERMTAADGRNSRLTIKRIDEWTYNFGPNKFLRILTFEDGRLVNVETGDRGF